jgi:hypothetical protein
MTPDCSLDLCRAFSDAGHVGDIDSGNGAGLQLPHQVSLGFERLADDEQTAGIFVQAMHDACAWKTGERRGVMEQRIQQRAVQIAAAWMHHQSRGLIDDHDLCIFVDDAQRNRLRRAGERIEHRLGLHHESVPAPHFVFRLSRRSVHRHPRLSYPVLQATA